MTTFSHSTARNAYGIEFPPRKAVHVLTALSGCLMDRQRKSDLITARDLTNHADGSLSIAEGIDYWIRLGMVARVATMEGNRPRVGYQVNGDRLQAYYEVYNKTDGFGLAPCEQFLVYLVTKAWELGRPIARRDAYDLFSRSSTIHREVTHDRGILEAYVDPEHQGRYIYQATEYGNQVVSAFLELTTLTDEWRATGFVAPLRAVPKTEKQQQKWKDREALFAKAVQNQRN